MKSCSRCRHDLTKENACADIVERGGYCRPCRNIVNAEATKTSLRERLAAVTERERQLAADFKTVVGLLTPEQLKTFALSKVGGE